MAGVPAPLSSLPRIPKKKRDDADIKSPTKTHRIKKEEDDVSFIHNFLGIPLITHCGYV